MGMYMLDKAKEKGVRVYQGEVLNIETDKQGVCAVLVARNNMIERITTRRFVNAAGPFLKQIGNLLEVDIPVYPTLHEKIVIKDYLGIVPRSTPMLILDDEQYIGWTEEEKEFWRQDNKYGKLLKKFPGGVYMRPEGGKDSQMLLIGWAYDDTVREPLWDPILSEEFLEVVLRGATKLVPELRQYIGKIANPMHDGGYYTESKENIPIIGPMRVDGAFIVGALGGYGIMAGCAAGELGAAWVAASELPIYAQNFSFKRYDNPKYVPKRRSGKL